ncbi:MAG: Fic family protein, partial [Bacteroidota bacterium]
LNSKKEIIRDKKAQGAGHLMVEVYKLVHAPLTEAVLFNWHTILMRHHRNINAGTWRKHQAPMQVVSGAIGREKIHFEAPPSSIVKQEMKQFIRWFNDTAPGGKSEIKSAPVRSAIAHLYFESIHPFEDGNGRIGRAIAEKAFSQSIGQPIPISISQAIEAGKRAYYTSLEQAQRSNEITAWIGYFASVINTAQATARNTVAFIIKKATFFDRFNARMNARQSKAIRKMMDQPAGFDEGMTAAKYISITRTSKATATRDLQHLAALGALVATNGGRSTRYQLNLA